MGTAYTTALDIAENLEDVEHQLRSLWGLWGFRLRSGQHRVALALGQRFYALAVRRPDPNDRLTGERAMGITQHYLGDLFSARGRLEHMLAYYVTPGHGSDLIRFQVDPRMQASIFLARTPWLQGFPEQAMHHARRSVGYAREANHALSVGGALAQGACPIALWVGDLAAAERYLGILLDYSTRYALGRWHA
jgi:hypothetical protein